MHHPTQKPESAPDTPRATAETEWGKISGAWNMANISAEAECHIKRMLS